MTVGIFGDQLLPHGPEAAEEAHKIATAAEPAVVVPEVEDETNVEDQNQPDNEVEDQEDSHVEPEAAEAHETHELAKDVVAQIEDAQSSEEVDELADGDDRKSVIAAAKKRKEELDD